MLVRLTAVGAALLIAGAIIFVAVTGAGDEDVPAITDTASAGGGGLARGDLPDAGVRPGEPQTAPAEVAARSATQPEPIGGPFRLVNLAGDEVTEAALLGHPSLMIFGSTHCTERCPPLPQVGEWLDALGDEGADLAVYYVTVDPERDSPQVLTAYLAGSDRRIAGLTGTTASVADMMQHYRIDQAALTGANGQGGQPIDQLAWAYLLDADGAYAGQISYAEPGEAAYARLRRLVIGNLSGPRLDALCTALRADNRDAALAAYPASLWRSCAERGFAEAQFGLALMLDEGVILPRNVEEAYVWAVRAGFAVSPLTARLQEEMRPLELEAALRRAQDWAPVR